MTDTRKFYVVWGSKGHCLVLEDIIRLNGGEVAALIDSDVGRPSVIEGVAIFYGSDGLHAAVRDLDKEAIYGAIAIGGARGADRQFIHKEMEALGIIVESIIHPSAVVSATATYGAGCHFMANATIAAATSLGRDCIINHRASVDHECILADGVHIGPGATLCGCVIVGENVFVGAGATVLPHIEIGNNATVGAGAVVTRNVPPNSIVAGNPSRLHRPKT